MTITLAVREARRRTATTANRQRQIRAELRLEEIVKVAGIADEYERTDRAGDLQMEAHFGNLFRLASDEEMRRAVVDAFVCWQRDEQAEERVVRGGVDESVTLLKANNPVFIEGQYVPAGSDGAA